MMGYVSHDLKIPDDEPWIAMVEITPEGEHEIIGYMEVSKFIQLATAGADLFYKWQNYLKS